MHRSIGLISSASRHTSVSRAIKPVISARGIAIQDLPTAPGDYIPYNKGRPVKRADRSLDKDTGNNDRSPREHGERQYRHPRQGRSDDAPPRERNGNRPPRQAFGHRGTPGFTAEILAKKRAGGKPPSLVSLADLSVEEIATLLRTAMTFKHLYKNGGPRTIIRTLENQSVALLFSKRSTRTRVASETSTALLGGNAMFLGKDDIQLGVNETLEDSAKVIGSMVDGIMARVGAHSEIEVSNAFILFFCLASVPDRLSCSFLGLDKTLPRTGHQRPLRLVPPNPDPCGLAHHARDVRHFLRPRQRLHRP